jgi:hypothetical protein
MRPVLVSLIVLAGSPSAFGQVADNASRASQQTSLAASAIGESGLKASAGVVALPLGASGLVAGGAGVSAAASGQGGIADGLSGAAGGASNAASALTEFSDKPLSVGDDVVIAPQPAPQVPYLQTPVSQ